MTRLFLIALVTLVFCRQSHAQPGKEDCGQMFDIWIGQLQSSISGIDSVPRDTRTHWFYDALVADFSQNRFRILDGEPTENILMVSPINTFKQAAQKNRHPVINKSKESSGADQNNYDEFIAAWKELSPGERYKLSNRSLLFMVNDLADDKDHIIEGELYFFVQEGDPTNRATTGTIAKLYQWLLDYVEYNRENPAFLDLEYYALNYQRLHLLTGVRAPEPGETEKVKEYLRIFSKELLYSFGRYIDLHKLVRKEVLTNKGGNFQQRLQPGHYRKLLVDAYRAAVNGVIDEIKQLKRNCAAESVESRGNIRTQYYFKDLEMSNKRADVDPPKEPTKDGMAQIAVLYEDAAGKAINEVIAWKGVDASGKWDKGKIQRTRTNAFFHVLPGKYKVFYEGLDRKDSVMTDVQAGEWDIYEFPPKGRMEAYARLYSLQPSPTYITDLGLWVYKKVPHSSGLGFDSVYLWFNLNADYGDFQEGKYLLKVRMPSQFFPSIYWTSFEITPYKLTTVEVTGYGSLVVETQDGSGGEKKEVPVEIMTREKNGRTGTYTLLRTINSYDKLFMKPGLYRLEIGYTVKQVRDISIVSGQPTVERISNMGSLLVTNGSESKEWVEIYDQQGKRLITSVRNNVPIDLPAGEAYVIRVRKFGDAGTQTFSNVQLQAGVQKRISW